MEKKTKNKKSKIKTVNKKKIVNEKMTKKTNITKNETKISETNPKEINPVTIEEPINKKTDKFDVENKDNTEFYQIIDNEKAHPILKILVVILLLILCLVAIYKFVIWNPKGIFASGINYSTNIIDMLVDKLSDKNILSKTTNIDSVLTMSSTDPKYKSLEDYTFDINTGLDYENNNYNLFLGINKDKNALMDLKYNAYQNKDYLELINIYDKIIKLDDESIIKINDIKKVDYRKLKNILKSIRNIMGNKIESNKLKEGKEKVNNNELNYVSLNMSKEEYSKLISNIIIEIKDNHSLINNIEDTFNLSESQLNNILDNIIKNSLTEDFATIEFKFYVQGYMANIVGLSVCEDNKEIFNYFIINKDFSLLLNDKNYKLTINKDIDNYVIDIYQNDEIWVNIYINELNDETFDADYKNNSFHGNIHFNLDNNNHGNIKLSYVDNNYAYSLNYDYDLNDKVESLNDKEIVNMENISEDDYLNIYNTLNNKFKGTILESYVDNYVEKLLNY